MIWSGPADQFHCSVPVGKTEVQIICLVSPVLRTWMVKGDRDGGWRGKFTGISPPRQPAVPSALRYKFMSPPPQLPRYAGLVSQSDNEMRSRWWRTTLCTPRTSGGRISTRCGLGGQTCPRQVKQYCIPKSHCVQIFT